MAEDTQPTEDRIACPICGEEITRDARKCTHCNEWIHGSAYKRCPVCDEKIKPDANKCIHCDEWLEKDTRNLSRILGRTGFKGKTLWDFSRLLIVPMVLFGLGLWFNQAETRRQNRIEEDRSQEVALQGYLDEMTDLLLIDGKLQNSDPGDEEWVLAQARTVTTLRQLDAKRREILLRFLDTAELIADPLLFSVERSSVSEPDGFVGELDAGQLSDALREQLQKHGVVLTPEARVIVEQDGSRWKIDDGSSAYSIRKEGGTLQVYRDPVQILRGADLSRADLSGADLSKAGLHDANLSGANLHGAYLFKANLYIVLLQGANLSEACLIEANLSGANLTGADLTGADLTGAKLSAAILSEADLHAADLRRADLRGAILRKADLSEADLTEANLFWADLRGADLRDADLRWADLRQAKTDENTQFADKWRLVWELVNQGAQGRDLSEADLSYADLCGAKLYEADLRGADLTETNLDGAFLIQANLRGADLGEADLSEAKLYEADLGEARYNDRTKWPDGFDPQAHGAIKED